MRPRVRSDARKPVSAAPFGGYRAQTNQHVFLGILLATATGALTNIVGPMIGIHDVEPYGPVFVAVMMGFFTYAMVRYHLLDILVILSRTAVFAISSSTVALIFLGSVTLVQLALRELPMNQELRDVLPTVVAALVIVLVLEPIKERAQLILNRVVMRRRYDLNQFLARVGKTAAECVNLDELLERVSRDIQSTIGASVVRVLLVDEKDPNTLLIEHSTKPEEKGTHTHEYSVLLDGIRATGEALLLEQLVHARASGDRAKIAQMLAELDAYLCVPLFRTGTLVGIINCGQKYSRDIYTNEDVVAFTALSSPLATAIENARLYRKLDEANQHRARILSSMRGGVIAVDNEGIVTTVNYGVSEILGPVEIGTHMSELNSQVASILEKTLANRRPVLDYETLVVRPDEQRVPVVMSSSVLTAGEDELIGAMVVLYDLTQVKRLEQNVQRAHRLSSVGTLAAGMAHEIKNPLVSIKTFSQLLPLRGRWTGPRTDIVLRGRTHLTIVTRLLRPAQNQPLSSPGPSLSSGIDCWLKPIRKGTCR